MLKKPRVPSSGSVSSRKTSMRCPDVTARVTPTRAVWMKPTMRGCVVAAALLALWAAPGVADAQALGDPPGLLELLAADATSQPAPEAPLTTEPPTLNDGEEQYESADIMEDFSVGTFPEPTDPIAGAEMPSSTAPATDAPTIASTNASSNSTIEAPTKAPTPTEKPTKAPMPTEAPTKEPTKAPTTTPPTPPTPTPTTATPAIRTHPVDATPTVGANISNANASHVHDTSASVSPLLLVGMAAFCAVFLFVWGRRRRGGAEGGGGAGGADTSTMSGMATTSSTEKSGGEGKKVQYSRIEDRPEEDDDDAEFGGRSGSWDDWEGSGGGGGAHSHRITISAREEKEEDDSDTLEDTRGTAKLTKGLGSSSSTSSSAPSPPRSFGGSVRTSTAGVKLSSPPPASTGSLQHDRLKEIVLAETKQQKAPSVASNSSNESFEVVHEQPLDLLSGSLSLSPARPAPVSAPEEDLFSQFGMVPTFKKGVQQPPAPVARSTLAAEPLNPFAASPPPSVSASSLFAADLEDVSVGVADASNEWGEEDDDWVQGL